MPLSKIEIHLLNPIHTHEVITLSRRLEADELPCSYWGLEAEDVRNLLSELNKRTLVALDQEHVAGIGSIKQGEGYQQHLAEISVAICPQYRQQDLARQIISELENLAQASGVEIIKALVWTRNIPSQKLFESLTYERRATLFAEFKSPGFGEIDDHVYYKRL
jgi:RimJ/RimL family protein N-acetyltransferase